MSPSSVISQSSINSGTFSILNVPPQIQGAHYFFASHDLPNFLDHGIRGYAHIIETGSYGNLLPLLGYIQQEHPATSLCLNSRTAFQHPASELCMQLIQQRLRIPEGSVDNVKTCLQESIMNAIIHGNLGIQASVEQTQDFQGYYDRVTEALNTPSNAIKRVSIFAWRTKFSIIISIFDQGAGFDLAECNKFSDANLRTHGRGMLLIRSFSHRVWQTHPNSISMEIRD